jgi:hypothetical protein
MEDRVVQDLHTVASQAKRGWIVTRDTVEPFCEKVLAAAERSAAAELLEWMEELFPLLVQTLSSQNPGWGRIRARKEAVKMRDRGGMFKYLRSVPGALDSYPCKPRARTICTYLDEDTLVEELNHSGLSVTYSSSAGAAALIDAASSTDTA